MTRLEMVEKIREKTGVTYEEAREALEKANWDMLDAIVSVEKVKSPQGAQYAYATPPETPQVETVQETAPAVKKTRVVRHNNYGEFGDRVASGLRWLGSWIRKGEGVHLEVIRKNEVILSLSLVTVILLFLLSWWLPVVLIIAGLFTGYRFRFTGSSLIGKAANAAADKAGEKAEELLNRMTENDEE